MIRLPNQFRSERMSRVCGVGMTGAMVVSSFGLTVMSFANRSASDPGAVRVAEAYAGSRSLVLVGALVWCAGRRAWMPLSVLLGLNGLVQVLDTAIGVAQHDVAKSAGPACFAGLLLGSAWWLHVTNHRAASLRHSDRKSGSAHTFV